MARVIAILITACGLFVTLPSPTAAQESSGWTVQISHFQDGMDDPDADVKAAVHEALESEFELRGIPAGESHASRFVLGARSIVTGDGEYLALALVEGSGLAEPVLDAAAENELWYADKPQPENLEEGRFVRQYVTREVFGDLMRVHDVRLLFFPADDLQMEISRYVDDYRERTTCEDPTCGADGGR